MLLIIILACSSISLDALAIDNVENIQSLKENEDTHEHNYTETIVKEPSCLTEGEKIYSCICGYSYTETIAKTEHSYNVIATVEPTCTETGVTTHACSCGKRFVTTTEATGHTMINDTCSSCGYQVETSPDNEEPGNIDPPNSDVQEPNVSEQEWNIVQEIWIAIMNFFKKLYQLLGTEILGIPAACLKK